MDEIERELVRVGKRHKDGTQKLTEERNAAIRRASEAGKSYRQIARLVGVNFQRVGKIVSGK